MYKYIYVNIKRILSNVYKFELHLQCLPYAMAMMVVRMNTCLQEESGVI